MCTGFSQGGEKSRMTTHPPLESHLPLPHVHTNDYKLYIVFWNWLVLNYSRILPSIDKLCDGGGELALKKQILPNPCYYRHVHRIFPGGGRNLEWRPPPWNHTCPFPMCTPMIKNYILYFERLVLNYSRILPTIEKLCNGGGTALNCPPPLTFEIITKIGSNRHYMTR